MRAGAADRDGARGTLAAVALLIVLPILVKFPLWTGLLNADPMARYGLLLRSWSYGVTAGLPTADGNIAYTSHALGTFAAREWLHGRVPWWNPYEGVGVPLAAEMQSAALFPPILLLALPGGQLLFHILLQVIAGLAAYGLLRMLALGRPAAFAGAAAFQFCGVFAWMANAVVNPVAFLPLMLLGVELLRSPLPKRRALGVIAVACGLASSIYAGFPEVAYLDGLLVAVWSLLRIAQARALAVRSAIRIAVPAIAGVLIAAPLLVAFAGYLPLAEVGMHGGGEQAGYPHLDPRYLLLTFWPYWSGGIFTPPIGNDFWGNVGGYAGTVLPVLAAAALAGRTERALRWTLAGWIAAALALSFGAGWLFAIVRHVPGVMQAALYRYLPASWLLAACVLAAMAIDDLARSRDARPIARACAGGAALFALLLALTHGTLGWSPRNLFGWLACLLQAGILAGLAGVALWRGLAPDRRAALVAAVLLADALALFSVPVWANRRDIAVELGGVRFLQAHLGLHRFATLGPIAPNYGTYFGIAEVNHNDLPVPAAWAGFVKRRLDRAAHPILFLQTSSAAEFMAHRGDYAAIGTRYLVAAPDMAVPGLRAVYADPVMTIYDLPEPAAYFDAPGCRLAIRDRSALAADCDRPAMLTRLELDMPGWQAIAGGRALAVRPAGGIFQAVPLPAGHSAVAFRYRPPYLGWALAAAAAGVALLAAAAWPAFASRRFTFRQRRPATGRR